MKLRISIGSATLPSRPRPATDGSASTSASVQESEIRRAMEALIKRADEALGNDRLVLLLPVLQVLANRARPVDVGEAGAAGALLFVECAADRLNRRVPPVLRALFGPQRPLHAHLLMRRGKAGAHLALCIHQQGARPARADIDPQPHQPASTQGRYAAP